MKKGMLLVIDGTDGSGKTTQVKLLSDFLAAQKIPFASISFPQYGQNKYANKVEDYLNGQLGPIEDQDPYEISKLYAGDRLAAKPKIEKWLQDGKLVLANRYTSSSKAHMGASLPIKERPKFFKWLNNLEYKENNMPKEDLTMLLVVDPKVGQQNVLAKPHSDLHENSLDHLQKANKIYRELSKTEKNWIVINCMEKGKMKKPGDIHQEIVKIINDVLISRP